MLKSPESASMKSYGILYKSLQVNIASEAEIDDILSDFAVDSKDPVSWNQCYKYGGSNAGGFIMELVFLAFSDFHVHHTGSRSIS